jgi:Kef-type K+ transport system membrane component KefB
MPGVPLRLPLVLGSTVPGSVALDLLVLLATAGLVALGLGRLRLSATPGYLIAGAIIGPHALEFVRDTESIRSISTLATILLMFIVGLHLDLRTMRGGLIPILLVGAVSTVLSTMAMWLPSLAVAPGLPGAMALAMAMSMSSTAVVLRSIEQKRELHSVRGRTVAGVLIVQDVMVLVYLASMPLLAAWAGRGAPGGAGQSLPVIERFGLALAGLLALLLVGRYALPRLLHEAIRGASAEVLVVVSAAVALASAVFTAGIGLSAELGAFLAGLMLSGTPFRSQLAGQLAPMRDLFMAVFFTAVGLSLDLDGLAHRWPAVIGGLAALLLIKGVVIAGVSWAFGASPSVAVYGGVTLAQGGEFSVILAGQAALLGVIGPDTLGDAIGVVFVSLLATPALLNLAERAAPWGKRLRPAPWIARSVMHDREEIMVRGEGEADGARPFRTIIAGFGPVGRAVADKLVRAGVEVTVIEMNPRTVRRQATMGRRVVYGDASNLEVLESAGLPDADAVILTIPDEEAILRACRLIRAERPDVFLAVRTSALSHGLQAMQLGADHAVVEEIVTADAMAREVLMKVRQRMEGTDSGPRLYESAEGAT